MVGTKLVVMLELDSNDPRLSVAALNAVSTSPRAVAQLRAAVVSALPRKESRVVAVMTVDQAMAMIAGYNVASTMLGNPPAMPHPDYVPRTQE